MYQFKEITLAHDQVARQVLIIEFSDPQKRILGEFLMNDASLLDYRVLDQLDRVLSGETEREESAGNRCSLEISREKTVVEDLFSEMYADFPTLPAYEMDTKKLRDLIIIWKEKVATFEKH